jgi:hypothetical protein
MTYTFEIESELPDLNTYILAERSNRYSAANLKKNATRTCHHSCIQLKGKVPKDLIFDIVITWHLPNKKKDPDNVAFGIKFIHDGLVSAKVLSNDGANNINSISHRFVYGEKYHVTVELIEK